MQRVHPLPRLPPPVSRISDALHQHEVLVTAAEAISIPCSLTGCHGRFDLLGFYKMPFSAPGSCPGPHVPGGCHLSFDWLGPSLWATLMALRSADRVFSGVSLHGGGCFPRSQLEAREEDHRGRSPFIPAHQGALVFTSITWLVGSAFPQTFNVPILWV